MFCQLRCFHYSQNVYESILTPPPPMIGVPFLLLYLRITFVYSYFVHFWGRGLLIVELLFQSARASLGAAVPKMNCSTTSIAHLYSSLSLNFSMDSSPMFPLPPSFALIALLLLLSSLVLLLPATPTTPSDKMIRFPWKN